MKWTIPQPVIYKEQIPKVVNGSDLNYAMRRVGFRPITRQIQQIPFDWLSVGNHGQLTFGSILLASYYYHNPRESQFTFLTSKGCSRLPFPDWIHIIPILQLDLEFAQEFLESVNIPVETAQAPCY